MELTERTREILRAIINSYISTAEPVGSRTITKRFELGISPATVRNIMADLEEMGFLFQPHTSAGRIPTDKAFRFYLDVLLEVKAIPRPDEQRILNYPLPTGDVNHLLQETTRLLSGLSHYVGVVRAPKPSDTVYNHIEFIPLSGGRALAVFVSDTGVMHNRIFEPGGGVSGMDLHKASELISRELGGRTLGQMRARIVEMMKDDRDRYTKLLSSLMSENGLEEPAGTEEAGKLFIGGLAEFFDLPDFRDTDRLRELFHAFEEKHRMVRLLDQVEDAEGVQVFIGSENPLFDMQGVSLVAARYRGGGSVVGTLGVIGPTRMAYSQVIPIVDCTAKMLGRLFREK